MARWQLGDRETGQIVVPNLELAAGFWSRLAGWQFRARPAGGTGLLLAPCASIHTCCLRFALDVAWLDRQGNVLGLCRNVRPWRVARAPRNTLLVLEVPAGEAAEMRAGQRLRLMPCIATPGAPAPRWLRGLVA